MFELHTLIIAFCFFLGAILYTSVGHAGASVYIAVMTFFDLPPQVIKPTALTLNIAVSSLTSWRYIRKGFFKKRLFVLLVIGAVPAAFVGGHINLPGHIYKPIIGVLLLISGIHLIMQAQRVERTPREIVPIFAVLLGAAIGMLSGITGTGGGIFLSPIIIWLGWSTTKQTSGTVSAFIFLNSIAGLLGNFRSTSSLPPALPVFLIAVILGAIVGSRIGITRFSHVGIKRALGCVLLIAGAKFISTVF